MLPLLRQCFVVSLSGGYAGPMKGKSRVVEVSAEHLEAHQRNLLRRSRGALIILPEVILAWVYLVCVSLWFLLVRVRELPRAAEIRVIDSTEYLTITACNLLFVICFVLRTFRVPQSPPSLKKAHYASVVVGAALILALQAACHLLYGPIPAKIWPK